VVTEGSETAQPPLRFSFSGTGTEYFKIWIVNLLLTILTLGIYSAWAKVRRLQYFYRNSWLNGANFDYHGDPVAILKGRMLAFLLLVLYQLSGTFSPIIGSIILVPIIIVMPILLYKSLRFRAINTSYSGLRFGFSAKLSEAYKTFLLWPLLAFLTFFVLTPSAHQRIKQFQHGQARFGTAPFRFSASINSFYVLYGKTLLMVIGLLMSITLAFGGGFLALVETATSAIETGKSKAVMIGFIMIAGVLAVMIGALLVGPYFTSRLQNLIWKHTHLDAHQLGSDLSARGLFWVKFTNLLGIVVTLGLYKPFADVRLARYRLEHMWLEPQGPSDEFVRDAQQEVAAFGEEAAEIFDVDISL
jgi:uncharacterized membrane protein YjgN (DUF898 family)